MTANILTLPDGSSVSLIKPLIGFRSRMEDQLKKFPFERNVFLMMRFRKANDRISKAIIGILKDSGLNGVRADQPAWNITNNVYNAIAVLYCCKYGIAVLDKAEVNQTYSPNVIYELGMMQCLERECLILKDDSLPVIPFDLLKDLYKPYKGLVAVRTNVRLWLETMGLHRVEPLTPTKAKGEAKLESAAVEAAGRTKRQGTIVSSPDNASATGFGWEITSRTPKKWTVSWGLKLTNRSEKPARYKVQVLFLDKKGFALDDQTSPASRIVPAGKPLSYKATSTLSPELAERIHTVMATVSAMRK